MHRTALQHGQRFFETYLPQYAAENPRIVEIGAQNVNGALRDICPATENYVGLDFQEGPGVDIVLDNAYALPLADASVDIIVTSSCFEHAEFFWLTVLEAMRVLKPQGLLYINAPSNGAFHRWPVDCWRFYPDAGRAMVNWARHNGYPAVLLESFIGDRPHHREWLDNGEMWSDFITVMLRDEAHSATYSQRMVDSLDHYWNAFVHGRNGILRHEGRSPDILTIDAMHDREQALCQSEKALQTQVAELQQHLDVVSRSRSWRLTAPLRALAQRVRDGRQRARIRTRFQHYGKSVYHKLPVRLRRQFLVACYRLFPMMFHGLPQFHHWQQQQAGQMLAKPAMGMVDINGVAEHPLEPARIAVQLHIFYTGLVNEFAAYLRNMPVKYDLLVSVVDPAGQKACQQAFANLPYCQMLDIQIVPNRGRDIAPLLCTFGKQLAGYDIIAHFHSKKSIHSEHITGGWRQYLLQNLLGNASQIQRILGLLQDKEYGIAYPQIFSPLNCFTNTWLANRVTGTDWCRRLGITPPQGFFDFPVGSMFWARADALRPLLDAGLETNDFPPENGQTDGTLAHSMERLFALSAQRQGYASAILADAQNPSWSPWRMEKCLSQPPLIADHVFNDPAIKVIGFDIFDTLLTRPVLNPEHIKQWVAVRAWDFDQSAAQGYRTYRAQAETQARDKAGRDVGLEAIYQQLGELSGLSAAALTRLQDIERALEQNSVTVRSGGVELYRQALATGKPVVLLSDMFLSSAGVAQALRENGIDGWTNLYVSNEVGRRKDSGTLYDHVWAEHGIRGNEFCMVGDNGLADFQIPILRGARVHQVIRPVEIARAQPHMRPVIEAFEHSTNPNEQLTLGLVIQKLYAPVFYPDLNPYHPIPADPYYVGYAILGPWLAGLSQWLLDGVRSDGVDQLYFLAREGVLLKAAFDLWTAGQQEVPTSHYLVVSRRAVTVPALSDRNDIHALATADFHANTLAMFLRERYGLTPDNARWADVKAQTDMDANSTVTVLDRCIDEVVPVLDLLGDDILEVARAERIGLTRYLGDMGLIEAQRPAVVDVGCGTTMQRYLNELIDVPVHGYYGLTDAHSTQLAAGSDVGVATCFHEQVQQADPDLPAMYKFSLQLEKLLSADTPQVTHYTMAEDQSPEPHFRPLSAREQANGDTQRQLREGALAYVQDCVRARADLVSDFKPSREVARQLYAVLVAGGDDHQHPVFDAIQLDGYYCGRGLV